ncbi:ATP-dependent RNA helicase mrh4, mitochondrial [Pseudocercospora fuligena]|uniref:RNA helicase n=1 Tax=Pseudocercospora fuligena TaxID=685502 RepID=A0A8H6VQ07_9PEZI|nr:ATP-dependent RNA helicase mrh4, mitochondrial [Pseudocercospora fuligena]
MLRLSPSVCPFCELRSLAKALGPSWQSSRNAATLQKRKPSRMVLSERVGRGSPSKTAGGRPTAPRSRNNPFGGMNTTEAPRALQYQKNQISAAERKRQTRLVPGAKNKREEKPKDPMRALKMQRRLSNVSYEKRNRIKQEILERESFDDFDLLPIVKEAVTNNVLAGLTEVAPSPIQRLAIPALLNMEDKKRRKKSRFEVEAKQRMQQFLLAAETGSGKTLAYLLPIIDALKRTEYKDKKRKEQEEAEKLKRKEQQGRMLELDAPEVPVDAGRPKAIILLPTAELVNQVGAVAKSLSHIVKFRTAMISSSFTSTVIRNRLFAPGGVDLVISTPHLLSSITESDPHIPSRVTHLVCDEADSLLDRSFSPITSGILDRATPSLEQLVFCSATIPRSVDSYLNKRYPETKRVVTPNLHAIPRRVQLSIIDIEKVPYQGNRDLACAQTIWDIGKEAAEAGEERGEKKIVVFVNEREKTIELANFLKAKGIDAVALSRDSDDRKQAETLAAFTGTSSKPQSKTDPQADGLAFSSTPKKLSNTRVLVTTDIGSRGIDTLLVKHVILYDVPHTSIDFIHRLGRVGRMGRRGRGIVLVGKNDRKDIVKEVREGMFKGQALI